MRNIRPIKAKVAPMFWVAALLFAASALLFLPGCQNPLQQQREVSGTGTFALSIGGVARTLTPVLSVDRFDRFRIEFTPAAAYVGTNDPFFVNDWIAGTHITLDVGTWGVRVYAFTDADDTDAAAYGEIASLVMTVAGVSDTITLRPIVDGTGTFSWGNISFPSEVYAASMRVLYWPLVEGAAGVAMPATNLVVGGSLTLGSDPFYTLDAGQHYVVFTLANDDGDEVERGHILHIYRNIDTELPADLFAGFSFLGTWLRPAEGAALWQQLAWLRDNAVSGNEYLIVLGEDSLNEIDSLEGRLVFDGRSGITIILTGGNYMRTVRHYYGNGSLFAVGGGNTLVLDYNVTLQGLAGNNSALVVVEAGGILEMNAGSVITGNVNTEFGGGVRVAAGGSFALNGGAIFGNSAAEGGGVFNEGTFTMSAGTIRNNTAGAGAGGGVSTEGDFTLSGGEIRSNMASWGGGVTVWWGGTFTMTAGTIYNNDGNTNGGGVFAGGGLFTMQGGYIRGNRAIGAANSNGGGVFVSGGAPDAGGMGTFNMHGGEITGNTAQQGGGGVANWGNGRFRMHGGTIAGNTANLGGGVINLGAGWFTMSGGTISDNTAPQGGGLNNQGTNATFVIGGGTIHGIDAGAGLANTAATVGAALFNFIPAGTPSPAPPGTAQVAFGALNPDHTLVDGAFLLPQNTVYITLDVYDGEVVAVSPTGIEEYLGNAKRFVAFVDGEMHIMSGWNMVPATGIWNYVFPTIPGNWTVGLQFAPVVGGFVQVTDAVTYTVTRNLVRGTNVIPFGDFEPPTTITITGIPPLYGDDDLHVFADGVRLSPADGIWVQNRTAIDIPVELAPGLTELVFEFRVYPGGALRAEYTETINLTVGANTVSLNDMGRYPARPLNPVTSISVPGIPEAYHHDDLLLFANGTQVGFVYWVYEHLPDVVIPVDMEPGNTVLEMRFTDWITGAVLATYLAEYDLAPGANTIPFVQWAPPAPTTVTNITITDVPGVYYDDWLFVYADDVRIAATFVSNRTDISMIILDDLEPGLAELSLKFRMFNADRPIADRHLREVYMATVNLEAGANTLSLTNDFVAPPRVRSLTITGIPAQYHDAMDVALLEVLDLATLGHIVLDYTFPETVGGSITFSPIDFMAPGVRELALAFFMTAEALSSLQPNSVYVPMPALTLTSGDNTVAFADFNVPLPLPWSLSGYATPFELRLPEGRMRPEAHLMPAPAPRLERQVQPEARERRQMPTERPTRFNERVPPAGESRTEPLSPGNGLMRLEAFDLPVAPQMPVERRQR